MDARFAARMANVHRSFIREILKVTQKPEVISFAGGLPAPELFPVGDLEKAAVKVIGTEGRSALQYSTTEGHPPLREIIAERYRNKGIDAKAENIIITTGSQQGLDLAAKIFVNPGDRIVVEKPGYLGAIQALSIFEPEFADAVLEEDGPDPESLRRALQGAVLFYAVTSFQNPSGVSYSMEKREMTAKLLADTSVVFLEDNPYGELRFAGTDLPPVRSLRPDNSILLGSFSKIAAPGFRLGWMLVPDAFMDPLVRVKQAADLHTSTLTQRIMHQYLMDNDIDEHIERIRAVYGRRCNTMIQAAERFFPAQVRITRPEGGMFLWATLPEGVSSMELFDKAVEENVAFVPGPPFHADGSGLNTMRLNFSNSEPEKIEEGIRRLGKCMKSFLRD